MNANKIADELSKWYEDFDGRFDLIEDAATMLRQQQALIENLNGRIERLIEKQSHYEAMEHSAGFEAGRQLGMKQERALWKLAASTQELDKHWEKHL